MKAKIPVTIINDGPNLLWQCESCEKPGKSLDGLYVHQALYGHDDYVAVGTKTVQNLSARF